MLGNVICYPKVEQGCSTPLVIASAETGALIGEGGRGGSEFSYIGVLSDPNFPLLNIESN